MWTRLLVVLAVAAATLGLGPAAVAGGSDGRIVWTHRAAPGSEHLMIARADGSHARALTKPQPDTFDVNAKISPDGRWVLYQRDTATTFGLRLIGIDGRRDRAIDVGCVDPCVGTASPTWLSNGRIAFSNIVGPFEGPNESAAQAVVWTARPDGSDVRRLSTPGIDGVFEDEFARLSPDGSYFTFMRRRNDTLESALFRMSRKGTNVRQLTPWSLRAEIHDLSPARRGPTEDLLVFQVYGPGNPDETSVDLATVPATCRSLASCTAQIRYLTTNAGGERRNANPAWSPSGRRIVFTDRASSAVENAEIWTMRYDGTRWERVTTSPEFDYRPDWGGRLS